MDLEDKIQCLKQELRESEANVHKAAAFGKDLLERNRELELGNEELITNAMDLEDKIQCLKQELRESEANVHKAAAFGKDLLERNRELELRNEELITEHTTQIEGLEQEKYSLQMQLVSKESMERHHISEIEILQEKLKQETMHLRERLELEHSREVQKVRTTCEGLKSDLELSRIENQQLKEQVTSLEDALEEARNKANITLLDVTTTSEERLSALQEEVIKITTEKVHLSSRVKDMSNELEQVRFTNHKLKERNEEVEGRAEEEHQQCLTYSRSLQAAHKQLEELQAELDLMKLESTDPNKKGNSLFAEVEEKRQAIEKKMISLQLHHNALQKQFNHKKQQVHGLKYQIAGLLQMDRGRVAAEQVEKLEQMLSQSRSEVQALTQKLQASQSQQRPEFSEQFEPAPSSVGTPANQHVDGLKKFYQSMLEQAKKEKQKLEKEFRSERTKRISLEDQLIECQRSLYGAEREVQRIKSANVMITVKMDELKCKLAENGIVVDKEVKGGYTEKIRIPDKFKKKTKESSAPQNDDAATKQDTPTTKPNPTAAKPDSREPLVEQGSNIPPRDASIPKEAVSKDAIPNNASSEDAVPRRKCVSIMEAVTVVNDDGSQSKRTVTEDEELVEMKKKQKKEDGGVRGRRGGRVVTNAPHIHAKGEKNECKQQ